jgi:hypothetical protein
VLDNYASRNESLGASRQGKNAEQQTRRTDMKKPTSRLIALGLLSFGLFATGNGLAYFDGTNWGWPNPEFTDEDDSTYLGDGDVWNWNGSSYDNGWSFARWQGEDPHTMSWYGKYSLNTSSDTVTFNSGAAQTHGGYKLVEYYWDGATYDYGESNISPSSGPWTNGGCD